MLLSTAIVESGLDIPNANTLIVHRADMFGLAQLYQLRGRVGRSKTRAYAYLTTPPGKRLTEGAEKRLKVLHSLDTLGAGFSLATPRPRHPRRRQPARRRAVGPHPRGRLRAVPVDAGGDDRGASRAATSARSTSSGARRSSLGTPVLLPETYITDLQVRLGLYRRLVHAHDARGHRRLRRRTGRPLRGAADRGRAPARRHGDQGAVPPRRHRPDRRRPEGRLDRCSARASSPTRAASSPSSKRLRDCCA